MFNIDEAIVHEREVAKEIYFEEKLYHANPDDEKLDGCIKRGKYHEQLAEWLEELKMLRATSCGYSKEDIELNRNAMYNKAIDDFAEKFIYKAACEGCSECCNCYEENRQNECEDYKSYMTIAEQLKAGGSDE